MLPLPTIFMVAIAGLVLLSVITIVSTGSILSLIVVLGLAGLLVYVLQQNGYLKIDTSDGTLNISFYESQPAPASTPIIPSQVTPLEQKEVFYIGGNDYVYDDAPAVCAAYDAELATQDQVNEAYASGAEWCGYGWTQGGMALFPTQESTWKALQQETDTLKRTACGRPGINGGYFDPSYKFGVNCYGVKPSSTGPVKFPLPLPGTDSKSFDNTVQKFKNMMGKMVVNPFNRSGWSEWSVSSYMPGQTVTDIKPTM